MRSLARLPLLLVAATAPLLAQTSAPLPAPMPTSEARASISVPDPGPLDHPRQPFDVLHYDVEMDLTAAPKPATTARCDIRLRWTGDPAEGFVLNLRDLTIDSILYNGAATTATPVGTPDSANFHYRVAIPASVAAGDSGTIHVAYHGTMTAEKGTGFIWGGVRAMSSLLFAMGVGFSNNYVSATQHWLPCYDHPSDKATFHGRFIVKKGIVVASNGILTQGHLNDSLDVFDWRHDFPSATYLMTFAAGRYVPLEVGSTPVPMVVYSLPADTASTRKSFKLLDRMVSTFGSRFVPYPFEKVGYVNTPIGSMEHQTMISFDASISRRGDTTNSTGAHELAHQWFGDMVSPYDFRDAWLNEGFATFCESLWAEELRGRDGYLGAQEVNVNDYISSTAPSEGTFPLYDFPRGGPSSNYPRTIYNKGAAVLGMLRYEIGDSNFFPGVADYLRASAYGNVTTDSLRLALERRAGRPLDWFFDQWVRRGGWPVLQVTMNRTDNGDGTDRVELRLTQSGTEPETYFQQLPVEIGFVTAATPVYRMVRMSQREQTVVFDAIPHFTTITVNRGPSVRALVKVLALAGVNASALPDSGDVAFLVRPNPVSGSGALSVQVTGTSDCSDIEYQLYDTQGRRQLIGHNSSCEFVIPTAGLASGAYVLRFRHNGTLYDVPVAIAR